MMKKTFSIHSVINGNNERNEMKLLERAYKQCDGRVWECKIQLSKYESFLMKNIRLKTSLGDSIQTFNLYLHWTVYFHPYIGIASTTQRYEHWHIHRGDTESHLLTQRRTMNCPRFSTCIVSTVHIHSNTHTHTPHSYEAAHP